MRRAVVKGGVKIIVSWLIVEIQARSRGNNNLQHAMARSSNSQSNNNNEVSSENSFKVVSWHSSVIFETDFTSKPVKLSEKSTVNMSKNRWLCKCTTWLGKVEKRVEEDWKGWKMRYMTNMCVHISPRYGSKIGTDKMWFPEMKCIFSDPIRWHMHACGGFVAVPWSMAHTSSHSFRCQGSLIGCHDYLAGWLATQIT